MRKSRLPRTITVTAIYAVLAAGWIYASDALLGLLISDPALLTALETLKGWLFVAITSVLLFYLLRNNAPSEPSTERAEVAGFSIWPPLAILLVFVAVVAAAAYLVYRHIATAARLHAQETVAAVAQLKAGQLGAWILDRRRDAEAIAADANLAGDAGEWLSRGTPDDAIGNRIHAELNTLAMLHGWSAVTLMDPGGAVRLVAGVPGGDREVLRQLAIRSIASREIVFSDFRRSAGGVRLAFVAPLISRSGTAPRAVGTIVMELAPDRFIYPLIQRWPLPSSSGETLLVRRDGNDVVYLNQPRHGKQPPLTLRISLDRQTLVARNAVLGARGPITGVDYRGVPVLAIAQSVPMTPWHLIAKVDQDEVNDPIIAAARLVALFGIVLVLAAGLTTAFWLQRQRANAVVRQFAAERERTALVKHLDYLTRYANDIILLIDSTGAIVDANERALTTYGYSRAELIGSEVRRLRPTAEMAAFPEHWSKSGGEHGVIFETVHQRKDGTTFPVEVSSRGIDVAGSMLRQSIIRDISERKEAEAAVRESEEKYRLLFTSEKDGVALFDAETTRIIEANDAYLELTGYTRADIGTLEVRDVSADPEASMNAIRRVRELGSDRASVRRIKRKDGREIWAEINLNVFEWRGRELVSAIIRDISEKKKAEENALLWANVLEDSTEGIMITDAQQRILTVNKAFTTLTGYAAEEVIGKLPSILKSGRHDRGFYHVMWRTIRDSGRWQGEIWNRRRNGEVYLEWLSITGVHDAAGELTHYVGIFSDITERKASAARIEFLANHDFLTGLPNRSLVTDLIRQCVANAHRRSTIVALLFLDLDRFKTINDSLGHATGDTLLQHVATALRASVRDEDTVARIGGDEFLIILPELAHNQDAAVVAEKIMNTVKRAIVIDGHELAVTASIGISLFPHDGEDVATLIKNADAAMYHAKERGRNNYQFFTPDMNARASEALSMAIGLRAALERNEFLLHYQPEVETRSGRIVGAEALIRWNHRELGLITAGRFIPIAEEHGLIVAIGEWVLKNVCLQLRRWMDEGLPVVPVAVNMSAVQFRQPGLASRIGRILEDTGVLPRYIELEVTESIIMREAEQTISVLGELDAMGLSLAIDDFGIGYSSLSYLRRFPIDKLKIDQSFVRDITVNSDAAAIATAIISMGKSLKLRVIAEGVETAEQLEFLAARECDELQGFHIGRPLDADGFSELLRGGGQVCSL